MALGTLGNGVAIAVALTSLGATKVYCISADLQWALDDATGAEGPIAVGMASGDLTVGEMVEAIDAQPTSRSDRIPMERARRPVRKAGQFSVFSTHETLNDGKAIRTPLKFYIDEGVELMAYARNRSGATLTTGAVLTVTGTLYMTWA